MALVIARLRDGYHRQGLRMCASVDKPIKRQSINA
jgi:hypothetical protein